MATKTPHAARGRKRANEPHLEDPGNIGRATGLEMPRFSKGSEDFDNLSEYFPTTGKANRGQRSGLEVAEHLQQRSARSTHKPPPPSKSPRKSNIGGTPMRPSSVGPASSAQTQATARSRSQGPGAIPKLDLTMGPSPRRRYTPRVSGDSRRSGTFSISPSPEKGRRAVEPLRDQDTDLDDTTGNIDGFEDAAEDAPETNFDNDTLGDMQPNGNLDDSLAPSEGSNRKTKRTEKPRTSTRRTRQSDQSLDLQANGEVDEDPLPAQDEEVPVEQEEPVQPGHDDSELMPAPKKKRGRPPKQKSAEEPNSKRARTGPAKEKVQKAQAPSKQKAKAVLARKDANTKIVEANETKSNVRERHETPFDEDNSQYRNRVGRLIIKPLAHWKNERASVKPTTTENGSFVYQYTDVIRMDDVTPQKRIHKRSGDHVVVRRRRKRKITTIFDESDPEDNEEAWEASEGVISGAVRMWDPELEAGIDEKRHQELAFAASKIEPRDNAEGSFRFAKTLTMPFFGSGIVELPPGGIKKTKNSRRMQMMFFVHFGKVTVEVAGTRFAVSKGGVWQVPRGNNYSIANETEHDAKLFFAQGCEMDLSAAANAPRSGELPVPE